MPYYANINPSYDGAGPHAGTLLDPFDYAEMAARTDPFTGTGSASDQYYIQGKRDVGSAAFNFGKGALFARWGTEPWMVISDVSSGSSSFGDNADDPVIYSGGVYLHTNATTADIVYGNVTFRNYHIQTEAILVFGRSGCSIRGSSVVGGSGGASVALPTGISLTVIDSYIVGLGEWTGTKGTVNATYTAFRQSEATCATFGVSPATNQFSNTLIPNTTFTTFGNQFNYLPYPTTVTLSVAIPPGYPTGLWGNSRTGIGAQYFPTVPLDQDFVAEADIQLAHFSELGYADIQLISSGRDVAGDQGLETAVLISLFTNRRVNDEKLLPDNSNDKGGWWGFEYSEFSFGSRLWLLRRGKNRNELLSLAEQYVKEALQWMIDKDVAETIQVVASFSNPKIMMLDIQISRPEISEEKRYTYRYFFNWENQIARRG